MFQKKIAEEGSSCYVCMSNVYMYVCELQRFLFGARVNLPDNYYCARVNHELHTQHPAHQLMK